MARTVSLIGVNIAVACVLFLVVDVVLSNTGLIYRIIPDSFRIPDARFHHALASKVADGVATWGGLRYRINTNSLGFIDAAPRQVPLRSPKGTRVLLIGNSFTEAVGYPWEKTFVGRFAARFPDVDVLNAAAASYSTSMYWKRVVDLIGRGYVFDHVVVLIDLSDVQDEAIYSFDAAGNIVDSVWDINTQAHVGDPPQAIQRRRSAFSQIPIVSEVGRWQRLLAPDFRLSRYLGTQLKRLLRRQAAPESEAVRAPDPPPLEFASLTPGRGRSDADVLPSSDPTGSDRTAFDVARPRQPGSPDVAALNLVRSMWTVKGVRLPYGYGDLGIEGAIQKQVQEMDALAAVLRKHRIGFSVGVYPWPDQMASDVVESRQVTIWRSWCERSGCERFINAFPDFFGWKDQPNWQDLLYISGDFHFNARGNQVMADRLIAEMGAVLPHAR